VMKNYILEEFNAVNLTVSREEEKWATMSVLPNQKVLGKRLGKDFKAVKAAIPKLTPEEVKTYMTTGSLEVAGVTLSGDDLNITREFKGDKTAYEADTAADNSVMVVVDIREDAELLASGTARELVNRIQKLRKSSGCIVGDVVVAYFEEADGAGDLMAAVTANVPLLEKALRLVPLPRSIKPEGQVSLGVEETEINDKKITVELCKPMLYYPPDDVFAAACGAADPTLVKGFLANMDAGKLSSSSAPLTFAIDGADVTLQPNTHFFASFTAKQKAYPDSLFAWTVSS